MQTPCQKYNMSRAQQIVWKEIPLGEGKYEVSSTGIVRVKGGKHARNIGKIKSTSDYKGYKSVVLRHEGKNKHFLVHTLVAMAFFGDRRSKGTSNHDRMTVNHKDLNPSNNHVDNLEWCTMAENWKHAKKHNCWKGNGQNKQVIDTATGEIFPSIAEAARVKGYHQSSIVKYLNGSWKPNRTTLAYYTEQAA